MKTTVHMTVKTLKRLNDEYKTNADPLRFIGRRVAKFFNDVPNCGTVIKYYDKTTEGPEVWGVRFDDNDKEDYCLHQLQRLLDLYEKNKQNDPTLSPPDVETPTKRKGFSTQPSSIGIPVTKERRRRSTRIKSRPTNVNSHEGSTFCPNT